MTNDTNQMTELFNKVNSTNDQSVEKNTLNDNGETIYIGEGKKYNSIDEADKAFGHLNSHLEKVEQENAQLREIANKAKTVDEVLEAMKHQNTNNSNTEVLDDNQMTTDDNRQSFDKDAIVNEAVERMNKMKQQEIELANSQKVVDDLTKQYGSRAADVYKTKAEELGIDLDSLARKSPKAVLEYFKQPTNTVNASSVNTGSINTASFNNNAPEYGTFEYWNDMQKQGKITRDEKFKRQHESLEAMGPDAFYGHK